MPSNKKISKADLNTINNELEELKSRNGKFTLSISREEQPQPRTKRIKNITKKNPVVSYSVKTKQGFIPG